MSNFIGDRALKRKILLRAATDSQRVLCSDYFIFFYFDIDVQNLVGTLACNIKIQAHKKAQVKRARWKLAYKRFLEVPFPFDRILRAPQAPQEHRTLVGTKNKNKKGFELL